MTVQELLEQVRYQINDTDKAEYTDAELINYINDGLRFISNELIRIGSSLLLKKADLALTDGFVALPSDFVKEQAVLDAQGNILKSLTPAEPLSRYGYKIIGNTFYSNSDNITLYYFAPYSEVSTIASEIPVPDYMLGLLKEIVIFIALNRNEFSLSVEAELIKTFETQVLQLANIGRQNLEIIMPFVI